MNDVNFIIKNVALFAGVSEGAVSALVADAGTHRAEFPRGGAVCRRGSVNGELIVILSGKAEVRKGSVVMRELRAERQPRRGGAFARTRDRLPCARRVSFAFGESR